MKDAKSYNAQYHARQYETEAEPLRMRYQAEPGNEGQKKSGCGLSDRKSGHRRHRHSGHPHHGKRRGSRRGGFHSRVEVSAHFTSLPSASLPLVPGLRLGMQSGRLCLPITRDAQHQPIPSYPYNLGRWNTVAPSDPAI